MSLLKGKIAMMVPLLAILMPIFALSSPLAVNAEVDPWGVDVKEAIEDDGFRADDPRLIIVRLIKFLFGFLGILAVLIILRGGFTWMTAGGNDAKVGEAQKMIIQGVVGLLVIFSAYALANFAIDSIYNVVNTN